jgi:hypothetical protein
MIEQILVWRSLVWFLVAVPAPNRHVRSAQIEARLQVPRQREGRRPEAIEDMARLALVAEPGSELTRVRILVTVGTHAETRVIVRQSLLSRMTVLALNGRVTSHQRVSRQTVSADIERGMIERRVQRMAGVALSLVCATRELTVVFVLMASRTRAEGRVIVHEIVFPGVAVLADYCGVPAYQWISAQPVGFDVKTGNFKRLVERVTGSAVPPVRARSKLAAVFIFVAIRALPARKTRTEVRRFVARRTLNRHVSSSERIASPGVVESNPTRGTRDSPSCCGVALCAIRAHSAAVRIAMAARAISKAQTSVANRSAALDSSGAMTLLT